MVIEECSEDEVPLQFNLMTDQNPSDTSWTIRKLNGCDEPPRTIHSGDASSSDYTAQTSYAHTYCLHKEGCFQCTIEDAPGDGLLASSDSGDTSDIMAGF